MIKVGIIGDIKREEQIYQILHSQKDVEPTGVYFPGKDYDSKRFRSYHNPIELLEISDAIFIDNNDRISTDFIKLMIRKSKHIFFNCLPGFKISETKTLLDLHNEAGNVVQFSNRFLFLTQNLLPEVSTGVNIVNFSARCELKELHFFSEVMDALIFLRKVENSSIKNSDVFGLQRSNGIATVSIRTTYSNGSVHNILVSGENIKTGARFFQKNKFIDIDLQQSELKDKPQLDSSVFDSFIKCIKGKKATSISFDDYYNSLKAYQEIKEKLNFSGITF